MEWEGLIVFKDLEQLSLSKLCDNNNLESGRRAIMQTNVVVSVEGVDEPDDVGVVQ